MLGGSDVKSMLSSQEEQTMITVNVRSC